MMLSSDTDLTSAYKFTAYSVAYRREKGNFLADPALHAPAAGNGFFQGDVFFSSIKENDFFSSERGTISFLEEKKQKTTAGGDFLLQERWFFYILPATKNGRFVCEPSVLCNALAKATGEQRANCSALDFLLLLFF